MTKLDHIARDTQVLRERLVEKVPGHFGMPHLVAAFFGALFFAFSFIPRSFLQIAITLNGYHLLMITIATWAIVSAEIYFVGYTRVPNPQTRPFGQFWAKRIISYYGIAVFTSFLLLSVFGITELSGTLFNVLKLVIAVSFPAAIGAAASDLLGKY